MSDHMVKPYPIALTQLGNALCIVVGGGEVASRKVAALLESGARIRVISPALTPQLGAWRAAGRVEHVARSYTTGDLAGAWLVIAATNRREVNALVAAEARERGMLYNVADDPAAGNFHTLGSVSRGDVLLAVSTGGSSPALAALIRRKLEAAFGTEYGVLAARLAALRHAIGRALPPESRTELWRALATDATLDVIRSGDEPALEAHIAAVLDQARRTAEQAGDADQVATIAHSLEQRVDEARAASK